MKSAALLSSVMAWNIRIFLFALLGIVTAFLLDGRINMTGLLFHRSPRGELSLSPGRVQLLLVTLALAAQYLSEVVAGGRSALPAVPDAWLMVLAGSHGMYLGGKYLTNTREGR